MTDIILLLLNGLPNTMFSHNNEDNEDFLIDYVKVWQNENYEQFIQSDDEFKGKLDGVN